MSATYRVTVEPLGRDVICRDDQSILDACLRAGIWLPHACTHGTCGTCKAEILVGEVDHRDSSPFALMDFERDEGKALICTARPRCDPVLEGDIEEEEGITTYPVADYTGVVTTIDDCAVDTRRLLIDLDRDLLFNPGQYVAIEVPGTTETRTYSLANPPSQKRRLELHIRRTPGGLASDGWIFTTLAAGDRIRLSGPYGRFFLRPARPEPLLFIVGGTGLAPVKSILAHLLESNLDRHAILYQGSRTLDMIYDVAYFTGLAEQHPDRFTYRPCLSEERADGYAIGNVTDVLATDLSSCAGHVAYVCGPPPMVEAALKTLMRKRLFPRDIYREDFYDASDKATGGIRSPLMRR